MLEEKDCDQPSLEDLFDFKPSVELPEASFDEEKGSLNFKIQVNYDRFPEDELKELLSVVPAFVLLYNFIMKKLR